MCIIRPAPAAWQPDAAHQAACSDFIVRIRQRNNIRLDPFDRNVWGAGADSTLDESNRSSQHPRLAPDDLQKITSEVWDTLCNVAADDFDCAFFRLAFDIRRQHLPLMTFGRTQKFINVLCKYAYCYYWSDLNTGWNAKNAWVRHLSSVFHIPVDAIVLHNLRVENRPWFKPLITTPIIQKGSKYARFKIGELKAGWSALDGTYPYIAVQQYVVDNLRGAWSPIHREMRDLW